ncbi:hypothetical protein EDB86DRAFT_2825188 [Lactarius hatsudake]|nr:hypothetical protein EDB86DRAFT_2825188 [Lactarius hatsudake]
MHVNSNKRPRAGGPEASLAPPSFSAEHLLIPLKRDRVLLFLPHSTPDHAPQDVILRVTNPIYIVKVRTFTSPPDSHVAHRDFEKLVGPLGAFRAASNDEGSPRLHRAMSLALFRGCSLAFELKRWRVAKLGARVDDGRRETGVYAFSIYRGVNLTRFRFKVRCCAYSHIQLVGHWRAVRVRAHIGFLDNLFGFL